MDFELTDEQRLIKDTAREFTDKEIVKQSRETRATTTLTWRWSARSPHRAISARSSHNRVRRKRASTICHTA